MFFNWVGYRLLAYCIENKINNSFEIQLDNNDYDEGELVSIKVPETHLWGYANSQLFERVDGQLNIKGVVYSYVKRRFLNDTIELLCIPNKPLVEIQNARNEFFKLVTDIQYPGQGKKTGEHPGLSKIFFSKYYSKQINFNFHTSLLARSEQASSQASRIISRSISAIDIPPEKKYSIVTGKNKPFFYCHSANRNV